ncbi:hypothetical protein [Algoriphagus zhangzhouensis]|uniref:Type IX secretion system membrane protein, PorP/SprF family n=1 Tax=Algoriphagus zhangzhouensis TaxID=1073327 RepID=A0A1M7Z3P4_9BACT|nr:hypothetical protein [Algoriphagus zhangzhouensis]TDY48405.1 hypothetical protein A8938_0088 [Algoriphagus zhangzhouensis]SHO59452.1 hypothetical protein SAMN04488108_0088 [Algoriphagus zhangzhouensis]
MRFLLIPFLLFGLVTVGFAQTDPLTQTHGAINQGLGNLRVNPTNAHSYFNNPGALSRIEKSEMAVGFDLRYGLKELSTGDLALAWKRQNGTFGFGISAFGGKLFKQQTIGMAYSNQMGIVSAGLKAELLQTQIDGFGSATSLIFSFGGIAELSPKFFIGANISNINRAKVSAESNNRLPTGVQLGINYLPTDQLSLFLEIEKDIQLEPITKLGISYSIQDWIILRSGINTQPSRLFFGLGILPGKISINYAYGQNSSLGSTHHLSFGMPWD